MQANNARIYEQTLCSYFQDMLLLFCCFVFL